MAHGGILLVLLLLLLLLLLLGKWNRAGNGKMYKSLGKSKNHIGIGIEQSGTNGHIKTIGMEQRQSSNGSIKTIGMNQRGVIKTIGMITAVAATLSDGKCNDLLAIYRSRG